MGNIFVWLMRESWLTDMGLSTSSDRENGRDEEPGTAAPPPVYLRWRDEDLQGNIVAGKKKGPISGQVYMYAPLANTWDLHVRTVSD